jgi:hypothetical protein
MHIKTYGTEDFLSSVASVDEKTFRKWTQIFLELLSDLEPFVVSFLIDWCIFKIIF